MNDQLNKECPKPWLRKNGFKLNLVHRDDPRGDEYILDNEGNCIVVDAWWDVYLSNGNYSMLLKNIKTKIELEFLINIIT